MDSLPHSGSYRTSPLRSPEIICSKNLNRTFGVSRCSLLGGPDYYPHSLDRHSVRLHVPVRHRYGRARDREELRRPTGDTFPAGIVRKQRFPRLLLSHRHVSPHPVMKTPDLTELLDRWYKRSEAQKRYSFFFSSTSLAGAFGGLLATAIGKMGGVGGYSSWRWVFIIGEFIV